MSEHKIETKFGTYTATLEAGCSLGGEKSFSRVTIGLEKTWVGCISCFERDDGTALYETSMSITQSPSELAATLAVLAAALELLEKERESMEKGDE